jgi:hypothetical protein
MRLDVCLRYPARVIATTAIYLAAEQLDFPLPTSSTEGCWWEVFDSSLDDLVAIKNQILSLYQRPQEIGWVDPLLPVEYFSLELMNQTSSSSDSRARQQLSDSDDSPPPHGRQRGRRSSRSRSRDRSRSHSREPRSSGRRDRQDGKRPRRYFDSRTPSPPPHGAGRRRRSRS